MLIRPNFKETLCVDYTPAQHHRLGEVIKVVVDIHGFIKEIGKELSCWDALDTGVFLLTDNFFQATYELTKLNGIDIEISDVIRFLVSQGYHFNTCDSSGCFWADIDTVEDLNKV